jgi:hypothetical protein
MQKVGANVEVREEDIFNFINDKALEEHKFGSVTDVAQKFRISKMKSRKLLTVLVQNERLIIVYENSQMKVYAPKEIVDMIVCSVKRPEWVDDLALPNKEEHIAEKRRIDEELEEYHTFEKLLYMKTKMLEEPVMYALNWLGFKVLKTADGAYADFEIEKDGFIAAVEVSGGNGGCPIAELRQLRHYQTNEAEKGRTLSNLLLLFNHYCDRKLEEREKAFAPNIIDTARIFGMKLATTVQLYEKIKRVKSGNATKEEIAHEITEGNWC